MPRALGPITAVSQQGGWAWPELRLSRLGPSCSAGLQLAPCWEQGHGALPAAPLPPSPSSPS